MSCGNATDRFSPGDVETLATLAAAGLHDPLVLHQALEHLAACDPRIARALTASGQPPPRAYAPGFATLVHIVLAQQVSVLSAAAAMHRIEVACGGVASPPAIMALGEAGLRKIGITRGKAGYITGLARAVQDGRLDVEALAALPDEAVIETLTGLRGIGRWSAEIYLLFALGRLDAFPAGDLAIRIACADLLALPPRPPVEAVRDAARHWRPWRGAAAVFLWHHYYRAGLDRRVRRAASSRRRV